jgi:hypothetical protein
MRRVPRRRPSRTRVRHNTIGALALLLLLAALVLGFLLWRSTQNPNPPHTPPRVAAAALFSRPAPRGVAGEGRGDSVGNNERPGPRVANSPGGRQRLRARTG